MDHPPEPRVTVVMATWQADDPACLREAAESILAQTLGAFEFIVVCDGPLPGAAHALLDELAQRDRRVQVLRRAANAGQAAARNAGIARARARYVAIMDADDISEPERLDRQCAFMEATGADVAGSFYTVVDAAGTVLERKQVPVTPESVRAWAFLFDPIPNPTVIGRTDVLRQHPYRVGYRFGEDYHLWVSLLRKGFHLRNQPEYLVRFRAGADFLARRRGFHRFLTDLRTKLRTFPLYPAWYWPVVALGVAVSSISRLMPRWCLAGLYALRNRRRYHGGPG